ncbi:MAG: hypothetical protein J2P48_24385, partial [Alphaproteobacteria bacterium]|nr:hypothetical protein [Alphaproteobacteria bacterium]
MRRDRCGERALDAQDGRLADRNEAVQRCVDAAAQHAAHPGHEAAIAGAVAWFVARTHAVPGNAGDLSVDADEVSHQAATKQITLARRQQSRQPKIDAKRVEFRLIGLATYRDRRGDAGDQPDPGCAARLG